MLDAKRQAVWYGGRERIDYAVDLAIRHKQLGLKFADPAYKTDLVSLCRNDAVNRERNKIVDNDTTSRGARRRSDADDDWTTHLARCSPEVKREFFRRTGLQ